VGVGVEDAHIPQETLATSATGADTLPGIARREIVATLVMASVTSPVTARRAQMNRAATIARSQGTSPGNALSSVTTLDVEAAAAVVVEDATIVRSKVTLLVTATRSGPATKG